MIRRVLRSRHRTAQFAIVCALGLLLAPGPAAAQIDPTAFACDGAAFNVQRIEAELLKFFQLGMSFVFEPVGVNFDLCCDADEPCRLTDPDIVMSPPAIEVNSMGFRKTDGMLYALELTETPSGNKGIIKINNLGDVTRVGQAGLPTTIRFDAGDVSEDGTTMYVNQAGNTPLYVVDLTALTSMAVTIPDSGTVNDWAFNPADGNLYGGDQTDGQVAQINPTAGPATRVDFNVAGLPSGTAFGGAWFNAAGNLFLYQNSDPDPGLDCNNFPTATSGKLYEIELTLPGPTGVIVNEQTGPFTEGRNDGAACIPTPPFIGAAKEMTATPGGLPATVTIQYAFENFGTTSPDDDMTALSALDNLELVFGTAGVDWTFTSITSSPIDFHNPGFDGSAFDPMDPVDPEIQLISQSPPDNNLAATDVKTITIEIQLLTLAAGTETPPDSGTFEFCNQVNVQALNSELPPQLIGDLSFGGPDPDPDMDDIPAEDSASCFQLTGNPKIQLTKVGALDLGPDGVANPGDVIDYTFLVENIGTVSVTDILVSDPLVSPITCPSGNPIPNLDPGESETCTGSYVITQADVDSCSVFNKATAAGMDAAGEPVSDTDNHTEPIPPAADIQLTKFGTLDPGADGVLNPGDVIDYVFTVENLGNVTLMNVSVTDPIVAPIVCPSGNPIPTLAPGAMEVCTGSYVVTQADIDAGERCNTATATGTQPTTCGPGNASDDDTICVPLVGGFPDIPTLGHLGLLVLALGLAGLGLRRLRRRR